MSEFLRIQLRHCVVNNVILLAREFANNFSTRALMRLKIFFSSRRLPQPQRKPEVRANRFAVIDNLLKQLARDPFDTSASRRKIGDSLEVVASVYV